MTKIFKSLFRKSFRPPKPTPHFTRPQRQAWQNPGAALALDNIVTDQMLSDAMVRTALTVKQLAILAVPWQVAPADSSPDAKQRAEFVVECFTRMTGSPLTILASAMDAFASGWSVQEQIYELEAGRIILREVRAKDPRTFGQEFDEYGHLRQLSQHVPGEPPRALDPKRFIITRHRPSPTSPQGQSDLLPALPHWQAKRQLMAAWKLHLEKFAMPTVLGKFERGLPPDEQAAILAALQDVQNSTAIVYPNEISIDTLGGNKEPSQGFMEAIEFHNREIARAILGQTLTTDEGRRVGSLALGKVHLQVLLMQVSALRRELADQVMTEQVIRPLVELNFGLGRIPRFQFEEPKLEAFTTGNI